MWKQLKRLYGRLMGVHVCEEFTQWEKKVADWGASNIIEGE
jgi:hypothetical protein